MERLPTHLEVAALRALAESHGGIATVLAKGERDAGALIIVAMQRGSGARLFERMPNLDGARTFVATRTQDYEKPDEFHSYLNRRRQQDPDLWILEVDVANPERFIELLPR